jgi:hypothetical protein
MHALLATHVMPGSLSGRQTSEALKRMGVKLSAPKELDLCYNGGEALG